MTIYFNYPVKLTKEKKGGYCVEFPDFPEAITQGETLEEAMKEAADCLEEAVANRIAMKVEIPVPRAPKKRQPLVLLHASLASKAALYMTMRAKHMNNTGLAKRLECNEKEVRRLLDPHYRSKIPRIEFALEKLGCRLTVGMSSV